MMLCDLKQRYAEVNVARKEDCREKRRIWWCRFKCWWHCRHDYELVFLDRFYECSICGKEYIAYRPYPFCPPPTDMKKGND